MSRYLSTCYQGERRRKFPWTFILLRSAALTVTYLRYLTLLSVTAEATLYQRTGTTSYVRSSYNFASHIINFTL